MITLANAEDLDQAGDRVRHRQDGKQRPAGLLVFLTDINSMGLQGPRPILTEAFYWNLNDADARLVEALRQNAPAGA